MKITAARVLATWFGCGLAPGAPGTAASACAVLMAAVAGRSLHMPPWSFALLALACLPPAVWSAGALAKRMGHKDPRQVVVDEVVGQWITLAGAASLGWRSLLAAFLLFRLFDIWKPPPVRRAEALPGGWGIVLDDCLAGLYGALVLFLAGCFNFY